jgi:hypothetical protein
MRTKVQGLAGIRTQTKDLPPENGTDLEEVVVGRGLEEEVVIHMVEVVAVIHTEGAQQRNPVAPSSQRMHPGRAAVMNMLMRETVGMMLDHLDFRLGLGREDKGRVCRVAPDQGVSRCLSSEITCLIQSCYMSF